MKQKEAKNYKAKQERGLKGKKKLKSGGKRQRKSKRLKSRKKQVNMYNHSKQHCRNVRSWSEFIDLSYTIVFMNRGSGFAVGLFLAGVFT